MDSKLWSNAIHPKQMIQYMIYHDCGKPLCITIDDQGKRHFPNHAEVSYKTWLSHGSDEQIGQLIKMDMDLHLMKSGQELKFSRQPQACSLIISALCEIHSNAEMFGGIDSTNFKIKWKHLDKFAKRILLSMETKI